VHFGKSYVEQLEVAKFYLWQLGMVVTVYVSTFFINMPGNFSRYILKVFPKIENLKRF
jgi:hypothetical protein